MSNGTLQQMASKGVQDGHLSISPETSFFKRTYKRVSNFAIEAIDQDIPQLVWGQSRQVQISRNGDLLTDMYLVIETNLLELATPGADNVYFTPSTGHAGLASVALEIGNNSIDPLTGDFLEILHELTSSYDINVNELVLRGNTVGQMIAYSLDGNDYNSSGADIVRMYIKLPFYFSMAKSQALPVIALQYHDIRVRLQLRSKNDIIVFTNSANTTLHATNNGDISAAYIMGMFAFLDSLERRLFAANAHEYLIRNVQVSNYHTKNAGAQGSRVAASVIFNHPCLAIMWYVLTQANLDAKDYFNWELTPGFGDDPLVTATIKFNGSEREKPRGPLFWRIVQSSLYWPRTPRKNLYSYSFANNPNAWFPTGSVNLSRIDNVTLEFTFRTLDAEGATYGDANITILALTFNVIRIQGGMCAKKYAN
jgi:hypothetical protein